MGRYQINMKDTLESITFSAYNKFSLKDTTFSLNINYLLQVGKSIGSPLYQNLSSEAGLYNE